MYGIYRCLFKIVKFEDVLYTLIMMDMFLWIFNTFFIFKYSVIDSYKWIRFIFEVKKIIKKRFIKFLNL